MKFRGWSETLYQTSGTEEQLQKLKMLTDYQVTLANENLIEGSLLFKEQATGWYNSKNFHKSIESYTTALRFNENDETCYSNRSLAYFYLKDFKKALQDANMCVALKPQWARGYHRMGQAYIGLKDLKMADEAYNVGLTFDPQNKQLI